MAPKKTLFLLKPADAPTGDPQWRYRNDSKVADSDPNAWSPYSAEDNLLIEAAYVKGLKIATLATYIVDTKQKKQINSANPLKQRPVKRFLISKTDGSIVNPKGSASGSAAVSKPPPATVTISSPSSASSSSPTTKPLLIAKNAAAAVSPKITVIADDSRKKARESSPPTPTHSPAALPDVAPPALKKAKTEGSGSVPSIPGAVPSAGLGTVPFQLDLYKRDKANAPPVLFVAVADAPLVDSVASLALHNVLVRVPTINRAKLDAASVLIAPTRRWLQSLGRPAKEEGVFIRLPQPIASQPAARRVPFSDKYTATCAQVSELARAAMITYVGSRPSPLLLPNLSQAKVNSMSANDHLKTQHLMISGPAKVLYDGYYQPIANPPTVIVCSTPGINFSYSDADRSYFTMINPEDDGAGRVLNRDRVLTRMRLIWQHVLLVMEQKFAVNFPVLCAIGCGAFKGAYGGRVPLLWGTALAQVICNSSKVLKNVKAIFVSLPTFGMDNNFAPFRKAMQDVFDGEKAKGNVLSYPPVLLIEDASMLDISRVLAEITIPETGKPAVVGMLNPSDVQAIRHGWVGMYWDGGHIALEEVIAMQTTLLLHHVGLNLELFQDPARLVAMSKIISDEK